MNPLASHERALPAAKAAMAAHKQGKFWEYYHTIFENMNALEDSDLEKYAKDLGLDVEKFKFDMNSSEIIAQVDQQSRMGAALGVTGTPAFFINGEFITGAKEVKEFAALIDSHRSKATKLMERGVPVDAVHSIAARKNQKYVEVVFENKLPKTQPGQEPEKGSIAKKAVDIPLGDSPRKGSGDKVIITEFSEFQ